MRLKDKVIIITGSTQGIGRAIARRFVAEGAKIILHGLERDLGQAMLQELDGHAQLVINDLTQPQSADDLVAAAITHYGRIDGIVNNAGKPMRSTLESTDAAMFDHLIAINLRAPLLLIRAAISHLKQTSGAVLNIGSINAYCGASNLLAYSISKGGLMTMTRNLADSLCHDQVRLNQINLGWVLTDNEKKIMTDGGLPEDWWQNPPKSAAPSGRLIQPQTIATAAVYWMGDESRPISGSVVELDQYPVIGRNTAKEKTAK